jgi:hypothetical protein
MPEISGINNRISVFLPLALSVYLNLKLLLPGTFTFTSYRFSASAYLASSLYGEELTQDFCADPELIQPESSTAPTTFFHSHSFTLFLTQCAEAKLAFEKPRTLSLS